MTRDMADWIREEVAATSFCTGCGHGVLMSTFVRTMESLEIDRRNLLLVSGIGCAGWISSPHIRADSLHALHGRAIPFATGAKLANPALTVVVISGDGDLLSIGGNHFIHAARRNCDITVILANNGIYGMTGGQTASTTPLNAHTTTDPEGNPEPPIDACRLAITAGARYAARFPVSQPVPLGAAIARAISIRGFTLVEALCPCPTQFGRRNACPYPVDLYEALDAAIVPVDAESKPEGAIVCGEFLP